MGCIALRPLQSYRAKPLRPPAALQVILGCAVALGALLMVAQRSLRRREKQRSRTWDGPGGSPGGPLPEGRRPLRLLSAVRAYLPRGKASKWTAGSRKGGRGQAGGAADSAGAAAVMATPRSARSTAAAGQDLESQSTFDASMLDSPPCTASPSAAAAGERVPAASPAQQAQGAQQRSPGAQRATALQAVDSIYSAVK